MRKLIYAINMTLDGRCDHTNVRPDEEILEYHTQLLRDAGLLVYGRKTYELMVPFWPDVAKDQSMSPASNEFARVYDTKDRLVFSQTLDGAADKKTRIVKTNASDEIMRLKKEPGKNMLIGGVSLASHFIELDLVDEFYFVFLPVVAGEGRRLLDKTHLTEYLQLKPVDSKIFKSGGVALHYSK
jgi:dihydrofolate reductase